MLQGKRIKLQFSLSPFFVIDSGIISFVDLVHENNKHAQKIVKRNFIGGVINFN